MAPATSPRIGALGVLFFLSGISGLIYQVVWLRMLFRTFGVGVYAVTTVVAVFMVGLALGAFGVSRLSRARPLRHLALYGGAEVAVGVIGVLSSAVMGALPELFRAWVAAVGPESGGATVLRVLLSSAVLLPPTILMGATLPLLSGHAARDAAGVGERVGWLYAANTLGAVTGIIGTGFFFIATLGETRTIWVAALINLAVGAAALLMSRGVAPDTATLSAAPGEAPDRRILWVSMLSGFVALSLEVIWERMLAILLGNSVYGFSSMLAAYLLGIALGSAVMSRVVRRIRRPLLAFGALEIGAALLAVASIEVYRQLGLRPHEHMYSHTLLWGLRDFGRIALSALLIVFPVTVLFGASFPLAGRLIAGGGERSSDAVGKLYGYNTLGSIAGTLLTGFVLIPLVGTLLSVLVVAGLALVVGAYLLVLGAPQRGRTLALGAAAAYALGFGLSLEDPFLQVLVRHSASETDGPVRHAEDRGATITVFQDSTDGVRTLFVNGLYVANTFEGLGELMVNLPMVFMPGDKPRKILAVGLGLGENLRYAATVGHDITVIELHRAVLRFFYELNEDAGALLSKGNARVILSDGRNYLLHSQDEYDLVLVDGSPPTYAAGMANLYAREFAELAKAHLSEDGLFLIWFPAIGFPSDLWNVTAGVAQVFPHVQLYAEPGSPNVLILGAKNARSPFDLDLATFRARWARWSPNPQHDEARFRAFPLRDEARLRALASQYPPNTDDRPYTEFPLQKFLRGEPYLRSNGFLWRQAREAAMRDGAPREVRTATAGAARAAGTATVSAPAP